MTAIAGVGTELCSAGRAFGDIDNDTDLDLAVSNGEVIDNIDIVYPSRTYEQRNLLLANDGAGRFTDVGSLSEREFALKKVGHWLAVEDLDNDGDLANRIVVIVEGEGIARTASFNRGPWRPW